MIPWEKIFSLNQNKVTPWGKCMKNECDYQIIEDTIKMSKE